MDASRRDAFNHLYSSSLFDAYKGWLEAKVGNFPFRLAETPFFLDERLREHLRTSALEIAAQLSRPEAIAKMKRAIPAHYDTPRMSALPDCVQIDFAIVRAPSGQLEGRVVELQAFPSLYALETLEADAWNVVLAGKDGLRGTVTCHYAGRDAGMALMRSCIVGDCDPAEVALVDFQPFEQKTSPDMVATKLLFDVDSACVTDLQKEGRKLFRVKDGKRTEVKRIYNRMVFDELEKKSVPVPFAWNEDLDITWCSHPNWYWVWSKYSLPHVDHPTVPHTRYLSEIKELPADLENYVLKPLFSFAGAGVIVDVTKEAIDAVPHEHRPSYLLQRKVEYAFAIRMPHAPAAGPLDATNAVKAEVRVMLMSAAPGKPLEALLPLVRLSRGKMLGVDQNRAAESEWTGGSVGIWIQES